MSVFLQMCFLLGRVAGSFEINTAVIPDIVVYPYPVYLVSCQFQGSSGVAYSPQDLSGYACTIMCSAELSGPFVVGASSICAAPSSESVALVFPSSPVGTFVVQSATSNVDSAIRFALSGGNMLYVCKCVGSGCSSGLNLVVMGQVNPSCSYSVASQSHGCTTCSVKAPIGEILVAGQSGGVTLYNGFSSLSAVASVPPSTVYTRPGGTIVNFISYDRDQVFTGMSGTLESQNGFQTSKPPSIFQSVMNSACRRITATSASLTTVPFSQPQYLGKPQCADPVTGAPQTPCLQDEYLPFTGSSDNLVMSFSKAGTVAVCTCGVLTVSSLQCVSPYYWVFASLLTVSGPVGTQSWSIPTGTVFGIELTGWGLGLKFASRDYIRMVPSTASCSDNFNNPSSITSVKIGCPNCTGVANSASNIATKSIRSVDDPSLPRILQIKIYESYTKLVFSSGISSIFETGDRIAISLGSITVNGLGRSQWSSIDTFRAFAIAGRSRFADQWTTSCQQVGSDCDDFVTGNIVTVMPSTDTTVTIPVGLDEFQSVYFSVVPGGAHWELHSRLTVPAQLKAQAASSNNKVCWGRRQSPNLTSPILYYVSAGVISFYQPDPMVSVSVTPTSRLASVVQPMTLAFVPDYTKNPQLVQLGSNSTVILKISLLNTNWLDWMQVTDLDPAATVAPVPLDPSKAGTVAASICGLLFTDFSLDHQDGFPQPSACMYSAIYSDQGVPGRDIFMHISPSENGWLSLRSVCKFGASNLVTCNYQMGFHGVLGPALTSGSSLIRVDITCPYCIDPKDPYLSLMAGTAKAGFASLPLSDTASDTALLILPSGSSSSTLYSSSGMKNSLVSVSQIASSSIVIGIARNGLGILPNSFLSLSFQPGLQMNITSCASPQCLCTVVSPNSVKLQLPSALSIISSHVANGDVSFASLLTVSVGNLNPPGGFAPNRVVAQLSSANNAAYAFTTSLSLLYGSEPANAQNSTARLVTAGVTGDGLLPFAGQTGDTVQMQFRPGRTVNSYIEIHLPSGYWCENFDWIPVGDANKCRLTFLEGVFLNAQSWSSFKISVYNPHEILMRTNPLNAWTFTLAGGGPGKTVPAISSQCLFAPPGAAGSKFSGNRGVLGQLAYVSIQPIPTSASYITVVSVFLKVSYPLVPGYGIVLIAPSGLALVQNSLSVISYPETYQDSRVVSLVPGDLAWSVSPYLQGSNSVFIACNRNFQIDSGIAFTIRVSATGGTVSSNWFIYTADSMGNAIEGSSSGSAWTVYTALAGSPVRISTSQNSIVSSSLNTFLVSGISVQNSIVDATIKVTFPEGFAIASTVPGTVVSKTVVEVSSISLMVGTEYTVQISAIAPPRPSLLSVYTAFVEIPGVAGSVVALPPIASVTFASVLFSDRTVGASQTAVFTFTIASSLIGGDFVSVSQISGNPLTVDSTRMGFASDDANLILNLQSSSSPFFTITASVVTGGSLVENERISISIPVVNPLNIDSIGAIFRVSTSKDSGQQIQGPSITDSLQTASLLAGLSTDKRPGMPNSVTFVVAEVPLNVDVFMQIQGPPGFVFGNICSFRGDQIISVSRCTGSEVVDELTPSRVDVVFQPSVATVQFTLDCTNPIFQAAPTLDSWIVTVNNQFSSLPIPAFHVSDFIQLSVQRTSNALSNGVSYPMRFLFTPRNSAVGLTLVAPQGYDFDLNSASPELRNLHTGLVVSQTIFSQSSNNILLVKTASYDGLDATVDYAILCNVFPPVSDNRGIYPMFKLTSFHTNQMTNPADESSVADIPDFLTPIGSVSILNSNSNFDSGALVAVTIDTSAVTARPNAASIRVQAPQGFMFESSGTSTTSSAEVSFPLTPSVKSLHIRTPQYMSTNPILNYFAVSLYTSSGEEIATGAVRSWQVVPIMVTAPSVVVSGQAQSAGSISSLTFTLSQPKVEANYVFVEVMNPSGFDFTTSTTSQYSIDASRSANCIALTGLQIQPNQAFHFTIDNVLLGSPGGSVVLKVSTLYVDAKATSSDPVSVENNWREDSGIITPFFMPGKITLSSGSLANKDLESIVPSYASSLYLNPIINSLSTANLVFTLSLPPVALPSASQRLDQPVTIIVRISVIGSDYSFPSLVDSILISPPIGPLVDFQLNADSVSATYSSMVSYWVTSTTISFTVSADVTPLTPGTKSSWLINMYANDTLINTNDGSPLFPTSASSIPVSIFDETAAVSLKVSDPGSLQAPQTSVVTSILLGVSLPASTAAVSIYCPPGIVFQSVACATRALCTLSPTKLVISSPSSDPLVTPFSADLTILTAQDIDTASIPYVVVATKTHFNGPQLAWGPIQGVNVFPMTTVSFIYPGMSGVIQTLLLVDFDARDNSHIVSLEITAPLAILLTCSTVYSIPYLECTKGSTITSGLTMNLTTSTTNSGFLPKGHYTLPILATLPLLTPTVNTFNIVARDSNGANSDGIYNYPGRTILDSEILSVSQVNVTLSSKRSGSTAIATVSFYNMQNTTSVDAITLSFPPGYYHQIVSTSQVVCLNRNFPRKSQTSWLITDNTQQITFLVDNTKTTILSQVTGLPVALNLIQGAQTYVFQFPLVLPTSTPQASNYWVLSFCADRTQLQSCVMTSPSAALAQFPVLADEILTR